MLFVSALEFMITIRLLRKSYGVLPREKRGRMNAGRHQHLRSRRPERIFYFQPARRTFRLTA
jgi:hypothetical protein